MPGRRVGAPLANLQSQGANALDSFLDAARPGARVVPTPAIKPEHPGTAAKPAKPQESGLDKLA